MVVSEDSALSLDAGGPMTIRVVSSSEEYLQMMVGSSSSVLSMSRDGFSVTSWKCSGIQVEPTSCVDMSVNVPFVSMSEEKNEILVGGVVDASVQSLEVASNVQKLLARCFPQDASTNSPLLPRVILPDVKLNVVDIRVHIVAENIKTNDSDVLCKRVVINKESGMAAALSGLQTSIWPEITVGIEWIETFYFPGVCSLQSPVQCTTLSFIGEALHVNMVSVNVISLRTGIEFTTAQTVNSYSAGCDLAIPFPIRFSLKEMILNFPVSDEGKTTRLREIELNVNPTEIDHFWEVERLEGAALCVAIRQMENKMLKLEAIRASGIVYSSKADFIHRFAFTVKTAIVVAGFSSVDWSNMFGGEATEVEKVPMFLPFASIEPFAAHLAYEGKVLAARLTVDGPEHQIGRFGKALDECHPQQSSFHYHKYRNSRRERFRNDSEERWAHGDGENSGWICSGIGYWACRR